MTVLVGHGEKCDLPTGADIPALPCGFEMHNVGEDHNTLVAQPEYPHLFLLKNNRNIYLHSKIQNVEKCTKNILIWK